MCPHRKYHYENIFLVPDVDINSSLYNCMTRNYFLFLFNFLENFLRLSTSFDEVNVYPLPAALYLFKNLLQVRTYTCKNWWNPSTQTICIISNLLLLLLVLYLCICRCPRLPDTEEPKYYHHWCFVSSFSKEEVRNLSLVNSLISLQNNYLRNISPSFLIFFQAK